MSNSITSFDVVPAAEAAPAKDVAVREKRPRTAREARERARDRGGRSQKYDAAQTTDENRNHWANADALSANAANSPGVRENLRKRSRYERFNNGNAKGMIKGRTNDTVGTGPRLQLDFPDEFQDPDFAVPQTTGTPETSAEDLARQVEAKWCAWCEAIGYTDKVRTLADAEDTDGEGFGLFVTNPNLEGVQLDLRVIECDRVTTPGLVIQTANIIDGIILDNIGNPVEYHVLTQHPGDAARIFANVWDYQRIPARNVIHLFEKERPEQARGIPLLTAALPIFAILRRFTLASLGSAELGAMIAGVIESPDGPPDGEGAEAPDIAAMDQVPFARNALLSLYGGQTAKAFDTKQPTIGFGDFRRNVLTEAGRGAGEMENTATGSSANYNYSSGRLDHLPRQTGICIRRERFDRHLHDRVFRAWLAEAVTIPGYLPEGLPPVSEWRWKWQYDGFPSIDPLKDANAQKIRKENGLTTDADELAKEGKDWREVYRQRSREKKLRVELGIDQVPPPAAPPAAPPADQADAGDQGDAGDTADNAEGDPANA